MDRLRVIFNYNGQIHKRSLWLPLLSNNSNSELWGNSGQKPRLKSKWKDCVFPAGLARPWLTLRDQYSDVLVKATYLFVGGERHFTGKFFHFLSMTSSMRLSKYLVSSLISPLSSAWCTPLSSILMPVSDVSDIHSLSWKPPWRTV